jgi:hypothetical protein
MLLSSGEQNSILYDEHIVIEVIGTLNGITAGVWVTYSQYRLRWHPYTQLL